MQQNKIFSSTLIQGLVQTANAILADCPAENFEDSESLADYILDADHVLRFGGKEAGDELETLLKIWGYEQIKSQVTLVCNFI